jgi:hypothetical protein
MKMTPFLSHWEEQRHLLVWVGLVRDRSIGDRIPIGKLDAALPAYCHSQVDKNPIFKNYIFFVKEEPHAHGWFMNHV